jgi:hypothetical protein
MSNITNNPVVGLADVRETYRVGEVVVSFASCVLYRVPGRCDRVGDMAEQRGWC